MRSEAVFFGKSEGNSLGRVYGPEQRAKLNQYVHLHEVMVDVSSLEQHAELLSRVEFIFSTWGMPILNEEEIRTYLPQLKAVFYAAGSVQTFARPFLQCGKQVFSAAAANGIPVAEYTLAQILLANKGFLPSAALAKRDRRESGRTSRQYPGNYRVRVGLLGFGVIGSKVAELLKPFHVEVLVFDPFLSEERAAASGVRKADLPEIFSTCQTISNHLANKQEINGIINASCFRLMGPNTTFINTGRGRQVVEADLIDALREVPTRTAILDVTDPEPPEPGSPLLQLDNVFLSPHIAGSLGNEVWRMTEYMTEELVRFQNGQPLRYNVTLEMLATMA